MFIYPPLGGSRRATLVLVGLLTFGLCAVSVRPSAAQPSTGNSDQPISPRAQQLIDETEQANRSLQCDLAAVKIRELRNYMPLNDTIKHLIMRTLQCKTAVNDRAYLNRTNQPPPSAIASPRSVAPNGNGAFATVQAKWQAQVSVVRAANAARAGHNDAEAVRLWRQIDAEPEIDVAFAGFPLPVREPSSYPRNADDLTAGRETDYARNLAWARYWIGAYYAKGVGGPRDYAEAARWYQKSINTKVISKTPDQIGSELNLGTLYAYGLGVPPDRERARQLWTEAGGAYGADLVTLLDHNALPKSISTDGQFALDVKVAIARLNEDIARKQVERARQESAAFQALPLGDRRQRCESPCDSEKDQCEANNTNSHLLGTMTGTDNPFTFGSMLEHTMEDEDCSRAYSACMRSCVSGP